ncbi:MAG: XdhC family protein [Pseudotabrizicola sp.]|uniref:XdhC family protein n=1 Tax=Pseudotabrizicola sp. TaxID=2939647 RepID=UPI0027317CAE|nr:XdhC family protein [Pseudotabrizicola sp.]MDP2079503.1 XdhC family protein [Pseudotabrizicola sp.]MDZ7575783.1 XdhC family protein [Pseudotabrizicola sp.]
MTKAEPRISDFLPDYCETAEDILAFVTDCQAAGIACALGVVTRVTGGSSRAVGTLFAVDQNGGMAGYVSNGCIDADVRLQALDALADGKIRSLIYGVGSPFVDLRLPCGGSLELLIDPAPVAATCQRAAQALALRQTVILGFGGAKGLAVPSPTDDDALFRACYTPRLRLVVAGRGAPIEKLSQLLASLDIAAVVATPDARDRAGLGALPGMTYLHLSSPTRPPQIVVDRFTAVLLLFHDHDWETALIAACLPQQPFYIGALGSAATHAKRKDALAAMGVPHDQINLVHGPVGLMPSMRNASFLAVSVIAEIMSDYIAAQARSESQNSADIAHLP